MLTAVVLPWCDTGCRHRARAFGYVRARLVEDDWKVVVGEHGEGAWCKALAVADALSQTQAEVLIVHDADVWTDGLTAAVEAVRDGAVWAISHRRVHRLTEHATDCLLARTTAPANWLAERPYDGVAGGGIVVVRRDVYDACPLDARFQGWGGEDESWGYALRALYGEPWRGTAPLVHLWHPPQQRVSRSTGSEASSTLRKRYVRARHKPDQMAALVKEAQCRSVPC